MQCRPLNYFASLYRQVQKNMMNMDQMLEMLDIEPSVKVQQSVKLSSCHALYKPQATQSKKQKGHAMYLLFHLYASNVNVYCDQSD